MEIGDLPYEDSDPGGKKLDRESHLIESLVPAKPGGFTHSHQSFLYQSVPKHVHPPCEHSGPGANCLGSESHMIESLVLAKPPGPNCLHTHFKASVTCRCQNELRLQVGMSLKCATREP